MKYLGGGKIETVIYTSNGRLLKKTSYIGDHTEITVVGWNK